MKKLLICLLLAAMAFSMTPTALADRMYVLPDSDKRLLTWDEVAEWDYESLGYAFNEIFARYGYDFEPGKDYDYYFRTQPWYRPNGTGNNQRDCYPHVSNIEWNNYELIKEVRAYKKQYGDWGRSIWENFSTGFDTLQGFEYVELRANQSLAVYSAPSSSAWRGANGKAKVGTNGAIYAAGWESGWLLLMYETNNGSVRVGYVDGSKIRGGVPVDTNLKFDYATAYTTGCCSVTDDPARTGSTIAVFNAGQEVTWLTRFYNNSAWDYVEFYMGDKVTRGFIKAGSLEIERGYDPVENLSH